MIPNELVNSLTTKELSAHLKDAGFKKQQTTWNRRIDGVRHVVDLQVSRDSFTFNFGVFLEEVWQVIWLKQAPRFVKESDCFPRFRIGELLSGFHENALDKWWKLQEKSKTIEEVEDAVYGEGLTVLNSIQTKRDALAFVRENLRIRLPLELIYLGVLEYQCGERSSGIGRLERLTTDNHWCKRAQASLKNLTESKRDSSS